MDAPPLVGEGITQEVAERVHVIPDPRIEFVPNVGIVVGDRATLVIDTAMGPRNGSRILSEARRLGGERKLLMTTTHFHPEHAFGAQSFSGEATYVCNAAQARELAAKGAEYIEMFSGFGPHVAEFLVDVELATPDISFAGERADLDLGGVRAELLQMGPAHTLGDLVVFLPESRVLFVGDLVEERFLPIFPDTDASGRRWLDALDRLDALEPEIVVGGHGATGGPELIAALRDYLVTVRDRVAALHGDGRSRADIKERLEAELAERQSGWDNQMWIQSAIDSFHAELPR